MFGSYEEDEGVVETRNRLKKQLISHSSKGIGHVSVTENHVNAFQQIGK